MADSTSLPDDVTKEELAAALKAIRRDRGHRSAEKSVFIRGEGGAVFEMEPSKMSADLKRRLRLGYLRQVNPDGSPLRDTAPAPAGAGGGLVGEEPMPRPGKSAPKKDWVLYAVTALGLDAERAESMTRQELIDLPADHALHPAPTPGDEPAPPSTGGRPPESAPKSEWIAHVVSRGLLSAEDAANFTKADLIDLAT